MKRTHRQSRLLAPPSLASLWLLVLLVGFPQCAAVAQRVPEEDCWNPDNAARCARLRGEHQQTLYGQPTIEQLRADGVQVRRAFYVSAHSESDDRDLVAIGFSRPPAHSPMVVVQLPRGADGRLPEPLQAEVPVATWFDLLRQSAVFDRDLTPPPPGGPESICLYGWTFTVEASDPAMADAPSTLRRRTANACDDDSLAVSYARYLGAQALSLFPACTLLDPKNEASAVARLATCAGFEGDRAAAADADNELDELWSVAGPDDVGLARRHFADDAVLDWEGEHLAGGAAVAARWVRGMTAHEVHGRDIHLRGETANRVRATLMLTYYVPRGNSAQDRWRAPAELILTRDRSVRFVVQQARVGRFVRVPPNSD